MYYYGSSPRVWGNCVTVWLGSTVLPVHPHTCGEIGTVDLLEAGYNRFIPTRVGKFQTLTDGTMTFHGSSPHVWGNFEPGVVPKSTPSVHPHACGEIAGGRPIAVILTGSSPHVWGNSNLPSPILGRGAVHPHACGEIEAGPDLPPEHFRFIPTRVGKLSDEPSKIIPNSGSSPHVWGNSARDGCTLTLLPVHPHACGEISKTSSNTIGRLRFIPTRVGKFS